MNQESVLWCCFSGPYILMEKQLLWGAELSAEIQGDNLYVVYQDACLC